VSLRRNSVALEGCNHGTGFIRVSVRAACISACGSIEGSGMADCCRDQACRVANSLRTASFCNKASGDGVSNSWEEDSSDEESKRRIINRFLWLFIFAARSFTY
jgi:hypothetical protein